MAKLVGVITHFVYWSVFGDFNKMPIDSYHMECLFSTVMALMDEMKNEMIDRFVQMLLQKQNSTDANPMTPKASHPDIKFEHSPDGKLSARNKQEM